VEVTWPASDVGEVSQYELWTATDYWRKVIVEKVQGFGGVVLPHTPSLVMVAFGIPRTLDQAPQRAVQAALALRRMATQATDERPAPELRMAVHWGQVLVDTGASDPRAHLLPIGDTLARPGRLLGYGEPGEIIASPEMGRLVGGWCELQAREGLPGTGPPSQIGAYQVVGLRPLGSPLAMHRQRPLSRFVGRARELALLEDLLGQAREGRGQVVGVVGEAGVGKSRLCYEFMRAHPTQGWLILETSADAYDQAIPYLPIIELLKSYFQIASRDDASARRDKVTDKLRTLGHLIESSLPALFTLLDVPVEDFAWQALDPPQRRQRILDAIKRLLVQESQIQPLLLVAENLHWIDGETQALLDTLVEGLPPARLLLLVSHRPEYQHGWGGKTCFTRLRLDPLPREHAHELLASLLGDDASLAALMQNLLQRAKGNPFFLEESVQALVETLVLVGERGAYRLAKPLQSIQVPATVQAVLAARIDRLPPQEKRLLQTAAVIGIEVPYALVQAVAELPEEELRRALAHLQATEFLYEARLFPDLEYTFKHALTQDVAYGSLPQERRRVLHGRVVEAIEAIEADRLAEQVDRLAHHALRGEVWDKAVAYGRQAGAKALSHSAYREAVTAFEQALGALEHMPETRATREQGIDLRLALRSALRPLGDLGRLLAVLREAESLAVALDDPRRLGLVSRFLSNYLYIMGAYDQALTAGQRALALATASGDVVLQALANLHLGIAYQAQGDYRRVLDCLGQTMVALNGAPRHEHFGQAVLPAVMSRAWLALCHAELGMFAEGRALGEEGLRIAEAVNHPLSLIHASWAIGLLALRQGDLRRALRLLEQAMGICERADLTAFFPMVAAVLGAAYTLAGRVADAVPLLTQAMEQIIATEMVGFQAFFGLPLGEAYLLAGRLEEARAHAEWALAVAREHQERGHEAYILWLLGDIAAHRDSPELEPAEEQYRQALALAEELGMRPLQAHCRRGLGVLYTKMGQREQARAELSAAIELYRSMEMTLWLPQAEAALAQAGGQKGQSAL
jgi:tetratricopeptide (TPR) repeat protein